MSAIFKSGAAAREVAAAYRRVLDAWPIPRIELTLPTRHGDTFVVACGPAEGPAVMLFHGAQSNAASWMFDMLAWSRDFRVYAVDVPGDAGFSAPVRPPLGSGAYAEWFEDLLAGLECNRVSLVGISLGGWLALDCATRRPERVSRVALLCPAGVGAQKNLLAKAWPYLLLGAWGARRMRQMVMGPPPGELPAAVRPFVEFLSLLARSTRARHVDIPQFSDEVLHRLAMPLLVIVGGKDPLLDSAGTRDRLAANAPHAQVRYLPEAYHFVHGQTHAIAEFLSAAP